ncbi:hypothetical protein HAX54_039927 [Datura stramonium]|uniref:Uncharacterized protein n=1 Tax=Datura stramonium TaxID=4076 RepID=A0ABS8VQQ2_DATST|nr:hypothetical protein [Datura stramonium]
MSIHEAIPNMYFFNVDFKIQACNGIGAKSKYVIDLGSLVKGNDLPLVHADCGWPPDIYRVEATDTFENITSERPRYTFSYTYSFSMGLKKLIDSVINSFCDTFQLCLGQLGLEVWRIVACLHVLAARIREEFTLMHLLLLYPARFIREGIIQLVHRGRRTLLGNLDDINDRGWANHFVAISFEDPSKNLFPKPWKAQCLSFGPVLLWLLVVATNLIGWVPCSQLHALLDVVIYPISKMDSKYFEE